MAAQPFRIGFLLYPDVTQLDMTGPAQVLRFLPGAELHFVWKAIEPVPSDCGLALMPTTTFASCPQLDMVCVPGGGGCTAMMQDEVVLGWLRDQAQGARYVTSVCTGSLILGAAGLLEGYRATSHWAWVDALPAFGAEPVRERVVIDRDRITGGGVTAGIDFGFRVIEQVAGPEAAAFTQLAIEYDPQPLAGGTPDAAAPELVARYRAAMEQPWRARRAMIEAVAARRRGSA